MKDRPRSRFGVEGSARNRLNSALLLFAVAGTVAAGFAYASAHRQARTRVYVRVDPGYAVSISLPEHYRDTTKNDRGFRQPHVFVQKDGNALATRVDWFLNRNYSPNVRPPAFVLMTTDLSKHSVPMLSTDSDGYVTLTGNYPGRIVSSRRNPKGETANVSMYELSVPSPVAPTMFVLFVTRANSQRALSITAAVPTMQDAWMRQRLRAMFDELQMSNICGYPAENKQNTFDAYIITKPSSSAL